MGLGTTIRTFGSRHLPAGFLSIARISYSHCLYLSPRPGAWKYDVKS